MKTFLERASEYRTSNSFKFYVPGSEPPALEDVIRTAPPPDLLSGEIIITEAHSVRLLGCTMEKDKGLSGTLYITNFRLFLVPNQRDPQRDLHKQLNRLTGEFGVSLTNVDAVYLVSGDKPRKLFPGNNISTRVKGLKILCKNMRVFNLNFDNSPYDHGKNIAKTLLHHAFPGRHSLLFAYECSEKETAEDLVEDVVMFTHLEDWEEEIKRTCPLTAKEWRVSNQNRKYDLASSLPRFIVVPKSIVDFDLVSVSNSFRGNRPPTWSWSCANGAALIRMADVLPTITERVQENKILENVRKSHPQKRAPNILDLDKDLPSIKDIQSSFVKLRDLCTPDTKRQFNLQDSRFYTLLDDSKWLSHVSACLRISVTAAKNLADGTTVVLQEGDGRDTSAVVASLVQLMLDPVTRTISGFQCLVQKEWVALGHPFCSRLGFIRESTGADQQSPVFLLFLDCVWQLQNQFPLAFEFSETYLTTLFDSCHVSLFDTFLFDCERNRQLAAISKEPGLKKRSVWNWRKQFSEKDVALFRNPLYEINLISKNKNETLESVIPKHQVHCLDIWSQCYFRWLPRLNIIGGGRPPVDAINRHFRSIVNSCLSKIEDLTHKVFDEHLHGSSYKGCKFDKRKSISVDSLLVGNCTFDNFYPFTGEAISSSNLLNDTSGMSEFDSQSVLNLSTD